MKCEICDDKGYVLVDEPWNATLQEYEECPAGCKPTDNPPPNILAT